jgi:hypothetical protein
MAKKSYTGLLARIRGLASRPEGVSYAEALEQGITTRQLAQNGRRMVHEGELIAIGYRHYRRYFSHAEDAQRYEVKLSQLRAQRAAPKPKPVKPPEPAKPASPCRVQSAAKKPEAEAAPAPVRIATPKVPFKDMQPIIPAHVKVQTIPSPAHFGPAARLEYYVPPASVKPLRVGKEV